MIPQIERISKIVDELQSKEEATRSEISQLNGRVSRLEESGFSNFDSRKNKRETKTTLSSTAVPCSIRACAFDHKVETNKIEDNEKNIPKSCKDLYGMGHILNGFYHIHGTKK